MGQTESSSSEKKKKNIRHQDFVIVTKSGDSNSQLSSVRSNSDTSFSEIKVHGEINRIKPNPSSKTASATTNANLNPRNIVSAPKTTSTSANLNSSNPGSLFRPNATTTNNQARAPVTILPPSVMKSEGDLSENWRQWKQSFEIYLEISDIDIKNEERICSLFLYTIGQHGRDIFNTLDIAKPHKLTQLYSAFEKHCNPAIQIFFKRHIFFTTERNATESFESFMDALHKKSLTCEFGILRENLLLVQFISGISNQTVQEHLLGMPNLTFKTAIAECHNVTSELHIEKPEQPKQDISNSNYRRPFRKNYRPGFKKFQHQRDHSAPGRKSTENEGNSYKEHPDKDSNATIPQPKTPSVHDGKYPNIFTFLDSEFSKEKGDELQKYDSVDMHITRVHQVDGGGMMKSMDRIHLSKSQEKLSNFQYDPIEKEPKKLNTDLIKINNPLNSDAYPTVTSNYYGKDNTTENNIDAEKKRFRNTLLNNGGKYSNIRGKEEVKPLLQNPLCQSYDRNYLYNMDNTLKQYPTDKRQMNDLLNLETKVEESVKNAYENRNKFMYHREHKTNIASKELNSDSLPASLLNMSLDPPNLQNYRIENHNMLQSSAPRQSNAHYRQNALPYRAQQSSNYSEIGTNQPRRHVSNCSFCGGSHRRAACPAFGMKCTRCGKPNHFEVVCKNVNY